MEKKYNITNFVKEAIGDFIGIIIVFGWLPFLIFYCIFEDNIISLLLTIIIVLIILFISTYNDLIRKTQNDLNQEKEKLESKYNSYVKQKEDEFNKKEKVLNIKDEKLNNYLSDVLAKKPYLAASIADFLWYFDELTSDSLRYKKRPAKKAADEVKKIAKEKRKIEKELRLLKYQMGIYEGLFPELTKYKDATEKDIEIYTDTINVSEDMAIHYLSIEEWKNLSKTEKYQLSLDRYRKSKKTNWQIGRDFERYVGYIYENDGYKVIYNGAKKGLEDLGRDLIATKNKEILIIQCKYWSKNKTIHEKHIFQLFGTTLLKQLENPKHNVKGIFICTNTVSDIAKEIAKRLDIQLLENYHFDKKYPCIKCNISKATNEKIYHLPFDQQYDNIDIEISKGEKYVSTIKEAEELGFRRAKKYISNI